MLKLLRTLPFLPGNPNHSEDSEQTTSRRHPNVLAQIRADHGHTLIRTALGESRKGIQHWVNSFDLSEIPSLVVVGEYEARFVLDALKARGIIYSLELLNDLGEKLHNSFFEDVANSSHVHVVIHDAFSNLDLERFSSFDEVIVDSPSSTSVKTTFWEGLSRYIQLRNDEMHERLAKAEDRITASKLLSVLLVDFDATMPKGMTVRLQQGRHVVNITQITEKSESEYEISSLTRSSAMCMAEYKARQGNFTEVVLNHWGEWSNVLTHDE